MFCLGFAILLDHALNFAVDSLMERIRVRSLVMQSGVDQSPKTSGHRRQGGDHIRILDGGVLARADSEGITQTQDQVFLLMQKLLSHLNLEK